MEFLAMSSNILKSTKIELRGSDNKNYHLLISKRSPSDKTFVCITTELDFEDGVPAGPQKYFFIEDFMASVNEDWFKEKGGGELPTLMSDLVEPIYTKPNPFGKYAPEFVGSPSRKRLPEKKPKKKNKKTSKKKSKKKGKKK